MRLPPFLVIAAVAALCGISGRVAAQCVTCDTNPGGQCIYVGSGFGSCTSAYYPDDFCKVACPNCPTEPCDTGGGGGGDCGGNFTLTPLTDAQSVITFGVLIRSNPIANGRLFRQGGTAILRGAVAGEFRADEVIARVREAAGWTYMPLGLAYAFQNVNRIALPVRFVTRSGEGFAFVAASRGAATRLQLSPRSVHETVGVTPYEAEVGASDLVLMNVRIHGQSYVLALRSESVSRSAPDLEPHLRQLDDAFRQSIDRARPGAQPLIMIIPDC